MASLPSNLHMADCARHARCASLEGITRKDDDWTPLGSPPPKSGAVLDKGITR